MIAAVTAGIIYISMTMFRIAALSTIAGIYNIPYDAKKITARSFYQDHRHIRDRF